MDIVLDASALINLIRGDVLRPVLLIPDLIFHLGEIAKGEVVTDAEIIDSAIAAGSISLLDDSTMSASEYLELLERHRLGRGETECLQYARARGFVVCADDRRARAVISSDIGQDKITGTIALMKRCVRTGLISSDAAFAAYMKMKRAGGFLPDVEAGYFSADSKDLSE